MTSRSSSETISGLRSAREIVIGLTPTLFATSLSFTWEPRLFSRPGFTESLIASRMPPRAWLSADSQLSLSEEKLI
jgi:hypothetical protein